MAVVFDGPVLARIPNAERATMFPVRRFASDVDQPRRPSNHRSRAELAVADTAKRDRVAVRAGTKFPKWLGGIIKIHHRATIITEIKFLLMFERRVDLAARHATQMLASRRTRIVSEDFQWHGGAAIHAIARSHTDRENVISGAFILENALDGLTGS